VLREEAETDLAVALGWPVTTSGANGVVGFLKTPKRAVSEIMARVKMRLPEYMAPKQMFVLNDFPLNSNGKVDRKALLSILGD